MKTKKSTVEKIGAFMERRTFLRKMTLAAGSFVVGVLGLPRSAGASGCSGPVGLTYKCCCLCKWPTNPPCNGLTCSALWTWFCTYWLGVPYQPEYYLCYECFGTCEPPIDNGGCDLPPISRWPCHGHCCADVICSYAVQL